MNQQHANGCDLVKRVERAIDAEISFADLGLTVVDEILAVDLDKTPARFAVLLVNQADPHRLLLAIRGTEKPVEWVSDCIAFLVDFEFAAGCRVEAGFYGIYKSFQLRSGRGFAQAFNDYASVVIYCHSLGGPLGAYLASQYSATELVCYASPKPGDPAFAAFVRERVPVVTLYDFKPDVVPDAPYTIRDPFDRFNFVHVATKTVLDPQACTPAIELPAGISSLEFSHDLSTYKQAIISAP